MGTYIRAGHLVDIYASFLRPIEPGGSYLVIVSAFSCDPSNALIVHPYKARAAANITEASTVLAKSSAELRNELELWGYQVRPAKRARPNRKGPIRDEPLVEPEVASRRHLTTEIDYR